MTKCRLIDGKCPEDASCPWWWETAMENLQTGEVRIERDCGIRQLPKYLIEVIKASNRPAAAVEEVRNSVANGFGQLLSLAGRSARLKGPDHG